jgi:hypothetical protein
MRWCDLPCRPVLAQRNITLVALDQLVAEL